MRGIKRSSKSRKQPDLDQQRALSRSNHFEMSMLLDKYDLNKSAQSSNRYRKMSSVKSPKRKQSPEYRELTDGLVTKLSSKISYLESDLTDKTYRIRELTSEIFDWKQKYSDLRLKYEKSTEKKKLLKQHLKAKVEALVNTEEQLEYSHTIIQDISNKYETVNVDKDRLEEQFNKEFESIVNTLSSMKVYDQDTIESDSLLEIINRSLREIQDENRSLQKYRQENERLLNIEKAYEELKTKNEILRNEIKNLRASTKISTLKKQIMSLVKNKLESHRSELNFLRSTFKSELSIVKSGIESTFNGLLLKCKESIMNMQFEKENQMMRYKQKLMIQYGVKPNNKQSKLLLLNTHFLDIPPNIKVVSESEKTIRKAYEDIKLRNSQLESRVQELNRIYEQQKAINEQVSKENDRNLINIVKAEYETKLNQYKKFTQKKIAQLRNAQNSRQQDALQEMLNADLDEFNGEYEFDENSYLPKSDTEDSNKSVFMYIKDISLLKQANYFLEKEKQSLTKEVDRLTEKLVIILYF